MKGLRGSDADAGCFDYLNQNLGCSSAVYLDFCCGIIGLVSALRLVALDIVKYMKCSEIIQGAGCK